MPVQAIDPAVLKHLPSTPPDRPAAELARRRLPEQTYPYAVALKCGIYKELSHKHRCGLPERAAVIMGFHPGRASQDRGRGPAPRRRSDAGGGGGGGLPAKPGRWGFFAFWIVLWKGNVWRQGGQRRSAGVGPDWSRRRADGGGAALIWVSSPHGCLLLWAEASPAGERAAKPRRPATRLRELEWSGVNCDVRGGCPGWPTGGATAGRAGTTHPPPPGSPARWPGRR